jgi:hypothetical protein
MDLCSVDVANIKNYALLHVICALAIEVSPFLNIGSFTETLNFITVLKVLSDF